MLLALLLGGCARSPLIPLYEGPVRPASELLQVDVPVELDIIMINERRAEGVNRLFSLDTRTLQMAPGQYRIVAYYKTLFELSGGNHEVVKSDPVIFELEGGAGSHFRLDFDRPADLEQARALARDFRGESVDLTSGTRHPTRASGMMVNRGFLSLQAEPVETTSTEEPLNHLHLLKAGWQNATAAERRAFLQWISEQPAP